MTDREVPVASSRAGAVGRFVAVAGALVIVVVGAGVVGLLIGRATAPGPSLVVMPGPVVQEPPAAEPLADSGAVVPDPLVVTRMVTRPPAVFTPSPSLSDDSGTASGYRLSRSGLDGAKVAQGLADVFGVNGSPTRSTDGWTVGTNSDRPTLTVLDNAAMSWSFTDPGAAQAAAGGVSMSPSRAKDTATAILAGVGVDLSSIDWQINRYDDHVAVVASQLLGGDRADMAWRVNFGQADAIISASGFAAEFIEVPGYPVIGAATDVRRAGLPTWSAIGPTPVLEATALTSTARPPSAPEVGPGGRPALRVDMASVLVVDAKLGLGQFWQPDGTLLVLPAYRLTGDDGSLWTLIAVTGDYVQFTDRPES